MYELSMYRNESWEWIQSQIQCHRPSVKELVEKLGIDQRIAESLARDFSIRVSETDSDEERLVLKIDSYGDGKTIIELTIRANKEKLKEFIEKLVEHLSLSLIDYYESLKEVVREFGDEIGLPRCELLDPGHRYVLIYGYCELAL